MNSMLSEPINIHNEYKTIGVKSFYQLHNKDYINPHIAILNTVIDTVYEKWELGNKILDLCAGSGEVTLELLKLDNSLEIIGLDPYTYELYRHNTHKDCFNLSFKDIAIKGLKDKNYDTIICSYALHLCDESMLHIVLWQLSQVSSQLIIITPHKRPECNNIMGWKKVDSFKFNRITAKLYKIGDKSER